MARDDRYFPFLSLAAKWASDTGTPPEMVLRNLCDWVITGAIPADALMTAPGDKVEPLDIFEARKAASAEYDGGIPMYGDRPHDPGWGPSLLEGVLVSEAGVRAFCDRTGTALPSSLGGFGSFLRARRAKHRAPPVCPDAEEFAAKRRARLSAAGGLKYFGDMLARLRVGGIRRSLRDRVDQAESFEIDRREWEIGRDGVQANIDRCGDVHLQHTFEVLDRELAVVFANLEQRHSIGTRSADRSTPADRSAGKVSERRLRDWYGAWVIGNEARGVIPSRHDDWEAAKAELGDCVSRDLVWSLRGKMAPVSWRRGGRRKLSGPDVKKI